MIIAGLMGSIASTATPTVAWSSIAYSAVNEGQQNTVNLNLTNWNNTDVYWYLVDTGGSAISGSQVTPNAGVAYGPGTGNFSLSFNFTFNNDATTDGELTYYVRIENSGGTLLIPRQGPYTCNDTSLAPTYTLSNGGGNTVNEGSEHTLNVGGTNVPGGTYYWTIETHSEDFAVTSGSVTVSSGTGGVLGSFTVTPTADATTEGTEQFTVSLRSGSITGTILATSQAANISDTSLSPSATPDITGSMTVGFGVYSGYGYGPGVPQQFIPSHGSLTQTPTGIINAINYNTTYEETVITFVPGTYTGANGELVVTDGETINSITTYTVKIGSITQTMSATPESDNRVIIYGADPFNLEAQNGQTVAVEITLA